VPKGFTDKVELKLVSVKDGSTIPNFILVSAFSAASLLQGRSESYPYLEKARDKIIDVVYQVNSGTDIGGVLDARYLNYFNKIGKNLQEDESINLAPGHRQEKAILTRTVRQKLLLSRSGNQEYEDPFAENASVIIINKADKTFTLDISGNRIVHDLDERYTDIINTAYAEYGTTLVAVKGTGIFSAQHKLVRIAAIESMDLLDPFDVSLRLQQLSTLQPGWYDGSGKAPDKAALQQFAEQYSLYFDAGLPLPAIFPTAEGNIQLEWDFANGGILLEIQLSDLSAEYICTKDGDVMDEVNLNLTAGEDWQILNTKISQLH
jgi:hypothetical protein